MVSSKKHQSNVSDMGPLVNGAEGAPAALWVAMVAGEVLLQRRLAGRPISCIPSAGKSCTCPTMSLAAGLFDNGWESSTTGIGIDNNTCSNSAMFRARAFCATSLSLSSSATGFQYRSPALGGLPGLAQLWI